MIASVHHLLVTLGLTKQRAQRVTLGVTQGHQATLDDRRQ